MNASEYQVKAARTLIDKPGFTLTEREECLIQNILRLAAETGKAVDLVKKAVLHRHGLNEKQLIDSLATVSNWATYTLQQQVAKDEDLFHLDARPNEDFMNIWNAIGLAGEAGETASLVYDSIYGYETASREKLIKELGDVLWYISGLCTRNSLDLSEVMQANITKLDLRYPKGYNEEDSKKRVDVVTA